MGFVLDSVQMRIYVTNEKTGELKSICAKLIKAQKTTIREVSRALGYMVSSFPGVMYGPLYFHQLEREKTLALRYSKGDYDAFRVVSDKACNELMWWNTHLEASYNVISHGEPTVVMSTDASSTGWGCALHDASTGGHWTTEEAKNHINYLELLAIYLALKSFSSIINGQHVKLMVDDMTAVSDVNHMKKEMTKPKKFGHGVPNVIFGLWLSISLVWKMWKLINNLDSLIRNLSGH